MQGVPTLENKKLVAKPHEIGGSQVYHLNRSTKLTATSLELHRETPNGVTPQTDFC